MGLPLGDSIPTGQNASEVILPATVTGLGTSGAILSQGNSQPTDFAVLHASYVVSHTGGSVQSVIANWRMTQSSVKRRSTTFGQAMIACVSERVHETPSSTSPSRHVGRFVQAIREAVGTNSAGAPLPQPLMWSAYVQYAGIPRAIPPVGPMHRLQPKWIGLVTEWTTPINVRSSRLSWVKTIRQVQRPNCPPLSASQLRVALLVKSTAFSMSMFRPGFRPRYNWCHSAGRCGGNPSGRWPVRCF